MLRQFMLKSFKRGAHPPARKETADFQLTETTVPEELFVSLVQHVGAPAEKVVAVGDRVLEGQLIAKASGNISASVHSPVSGTVKEFVFLPTVSGGSAEHVVIKNDFFYEKQWMDPLSPEPSAEEIKTRIAEAGIVGMGGAGFPTHAKLSPRGKVDVLIINGAECEPYITCDARIMYERAETVIDGVRLLKKVLGAERAIVAVEANKNLAINALKDFAGDGLEVLPLRVKYPQGAEKQLIYATTGRKVPPGALPADVGCVVDNVQTAYVVSRAVRHGQPLYSRALTLAGGGIEKRGNFIVRIGVPFSFLYDEARGEKAETLTGKVICGGPMMGFALADLKPCVTKTTSSLLFLDANEISLSEAGPCINCGRCLRGCPMFIFPRDIDSAVLDKNYALAEKYGVMACIECGVCSYVCPAKRPLVQSVRLAKKKLRERGSR